VAHGVPIGLAHDGADWHDSKLLAATLGSVPIERPTPTAGRHLDRNGLPIC